MTSPALVLAVLLAAPAQEKVALRWTFEKGVTRRYRLTQGFDLLGLRIVSKDLVAMTPTAVDADGTATIEGRYDEVSIRSTGKQKYAYDSESGEGPSDHPTARMMQRLKGQTFTYRMTAAGEVLEVKGFAAILAELTKAESGEQDEALAHQQLRQMMSDQTMKSRLQQMSTGLPGGPVGAGDTWTNRLELALPVVGKVTLEGASTLKSLEDGEAGIEQQVAVTQPEPDPDDPLAGLFAVKDRKTTSKGVFAARAGTFRSSELKMQLTLEGPNGETPLSLGFALEWLPDAPR